MKKIIFTFIIVSIIGTGLFIISNRSDVVEAPVVKDQEEIDVKLISVDESSKETVESNDLLSKQIATMSLDEKVGQLIIGGFLGTDVTDETKMLIQTYKLGGFILFQRNFETAEQSLLLVNELKRENNNNIPLFLSVDQEGGKITRLPELREMVTNSEIGKIEDDSFSYEVGVTLARQLMAYGMNLNFAPVLDVNNNPHNVVIGDRSFGSNREIVSLQGVEMMTGMQAENVIPVIKHFPGHGDTHVDSHESLPVISKSIEELKAVELYPFQNAIDAGADIVMTGHILLPELDANLPATLSKEVITDLLRGKLHFNGVVITDDITMGAISNNYTLGEAAVLAVQAGVDIVLVAHEYENVVTVFKALKEAVHAGVIKESRLDESVERILRVKNKYELHNEETTEINVQLLNDEINNLYEK